MKKKQQLTVEEDMRKHFEILINSHLKHFDFSRKQKKFS
jgi:hypothetical protein